MSFICRIQFGILVLTLLCCGAPQALGKTEALPSVPLYGERYVSMQKWARAKGFTLTWNKGDKTILATNKWARLGFKIDSRKATINGLTVWLSAPICTSGNTVYLGERDIFTLIHPVLYPEKLGSGKKVRTIAIAAGHGGKDPGNVTGKHHEKTYTLLLAKMLKENLERAGLKVVMIRDKDLFVELEDQAQQANRAKADLFINLHYNAAAEVEAKGIETYCLTPVGAIATNGGTPSPRSPGNKQDALNALLAYHVHKALLQNTDFADRGVRRAGFMVLRQITMPGVLIEGGFMTNPYDAQKIFHPVQRRKTAQAITDGILSYKRLVERK